MEITSKQIDEKIANGEQFLVDFWAPWCGPCKVMKPMFESALETLKEANSPTSLYTFNIENDREYAINLGIRSIPTIKGFKEGKEVINSAGLTRKDKIIEMAQNL